MLDKYTREIVAFQYTGMISPHQQVDPVLTIRLINSKICFQSLKTIRETKGRLL